MNRQLDAWIWPWWGAMWNDCGIRRRQTRRPVSRPARFDEALAREVARALATAARSAEQGLIDRR